MITISLYGSPDCRRYQTMRQLVVSEAARLNLNIHIDEYCETEQLVQFNPISLPRLYINGTLAASQNPPNARQIAIFLRPEEQ